MGAKFLCCLPLRLGVLVFSFIQFITTGALAGLSWWLLHYAETRDLPELTSRSRTIIIVVGAIYTLAAILGLLGFLGALFKKLTFTRAFLVAVSFTLGLQIAGGVLTLIAYYRHRGADCILKGSTVGNVNICEAWDKLPQAIMIVLCIVPVVIQAYVCYVVAAYNNRLLKQKADRSSMVTGAPANPSYQPVKSTDETYPLTNSKTVYPYADAPNSFGSNVEYYEGRHHGSNRV